MENSNVINSTDHQSYLLKTLKQKIAQLSPILDKQKNQKQTLHKKLREILQRKEFYLNQKIIQQKKYKSLNLLVTQLQSNYEKQNIQMKSKQLIIFDDQQTSLALENHLLRQELIKLNQSSKENQKIFSFLKQIETNKNNINRQLLKQQSFVAKSNFIQNQSEILAKIKSSLKSLENSNFQCRRKWVTLEKQKIRNQNNLKIYKIQIQRQKQTLKSLYDEYLQKVNTSKGKIFNQTQRDKILTDYLVEQVSVIQQKRRQVEDQNRNLHFHLQQLSEEYERIDLQNKELNSFFLNDNRTQESKLALKMKTRIQELRDVLCQIENKNSIHSILNKKNSNLVYLRQKYQKAKQANDYLQLKLRNISDDDKEISQFFTAILNSKDQKIQISRERSNQIKSELKQLSIKQLLLTNQINNMEEALRENSVEFQFKKKQIIKKSFY